MLRKIIFISLVLVFLSPATADTKQKIVATNSWTAAYAKAAGVTDIIQLAPSGMVHPPEYELKPSDVPKIKNADFIIYAGYEVLMKTVFKSFEIEEDKLVKIETGYTPDKLKKSIQVIAHSCGNMKTAEESIQKIDLFFSEAQVKLKEKKSFGKPVLVHFHQRPFAESLGFRIEGVFGPGPLTASQIKELSSTDSVLIIDNAHNPVSGPLAETTKLPVIQLINFPGYSKSDENSTPVSLLDVLNYNFNQILSVSL